MRNRILAAIAITCAIVIPGAAFGLAEQPSQASQIQVLPPGFHVRTVWYQIDDCGRHNTGQAKVIIWKGSGDMQSAVFCPNGTAWTS